ncbi:MAG TPA: hypothetical protein VFC44_20255 [Candidatus Saccharimonadales bacterium]|nr:hypothetical protein [Candidatus Saccharimonadales bacterium]
MENESGAVAHPERKRAHPTSKKQRMIGRRFFMASIGLEKRCHLRPKKSSRYWLLQIQQSNTGPERQKLHFILGASEICTLSCSRPKQLNLNIGCFSPQIREGYSNQAASPQI